jgi:hypothetical protein
MNPKSIALTITMVFFIIIFYLLGLRIRVNVGEIQNIQEVEKLAPAPTLSPAPSYYEKLEKKKIEKNGYLGPYGYTTKDMINRKNNYPHHNPMMYKKKERTLLNNITE